MGDGKFEVLATPATDRTKFASKTHTKPPWTMIVEEGGCYHKSNRVSIQDTDYTTIAEVWPGDRDIDIADGRLIAAAPELLAALERLLMVEMPSAADWDQARAAIRLAREGVEI